MFVLSQYCTILLLRVNKCKWHWYGTENPHFSLHILRFLKKISQLMCFNKIWTESFPARVHHENPKPCNHYRTRHKVILLSIPEFVSMATTCHMTPISAIGHMIVVGFCKYITSLYMTHTLFICRMLVVGIMSIRNIRLVFGVKTRSTIMWYHISTAMAEARLTSELWFKT